MHSCAENPESARAGRTAPDVTTPSCPSRFRGPPSTPNAVLVRSNVVEADSLAARGHEPSKVFPVSGHDFGDRRVNQQIDGRHGPRSGAGSGGRVAANGHARDTWAAVRVARRAMGVRPAPGRAAAGNKDHTVRRRRALAGPSGTPSWPPRKQPQPGRFARPGSLWARE